MQNDFEYNKTDYDNWKTESPYEEDDFKECAMCGDAIDSDSNYCSTNCMLADIDDDIDDEIYF